MKEWTTATTHATHGFATHAVMTQSAKLQEKCSQQSFIELLAAGFAALLGAGFAALLGAPRLSKRATHVALSCGW